MDHPRPVLIATDKCTQIDAKLCYFAYNIIIWEPKLNNYTN